MVARPPIESWSRPELENHYHTLLTNYRESQKKSNELEKKITQLNSRFRRTLVERKSKQDEFIERERYDEAVRENQLLLMKLKTAKHQLLTYTTPSARSATVAAMTSRSTARPLSTVRRPLTSSGGTKSGRGGATDRNDFHRATVVRINESSLAEKANVIKLNRTLREKNSQMAELQFQVERLSAQSHDLRAQLEQKSAERSGLEDGVGQNGEKTSFTSNHSEMMKKELEISREEIRVLKEANERLIKQSLSQEMESKGSEMLEMKKELAVLEDRVREAERAERESEKRRRQDKRSFEQWKENEKRNRSFSQTQQLPKVHPATPPSDRSSEESISPRKKSRRKTDKSKSDDVLMRLYEDVASILDAHNGGGNGDILDNQLTSSQKIEKWQKMYSELYDELEKVRNMLLVQHNINQKQSQEISLLQAEIERLKATSELKLKEMRDKLAEKGKKNMILEEQIRSIAYSGQKMIPVKGDDAPTSGLSTQLTLAFTKIEFLADASIVGPSFFLSLEFFDFELEISPPMSSSSQPMDFTTVYNVVVSNLFLHYLETNGITVEMYRPSGVTYQQVGAGVIAMNNIISKKGQSKYTGDLKIVHVESGATVASISYEIECSNELTKALSSYKRIETARNLLPLEILAESPAQELLISVQRCTGLNNIIKSPLPLSIVYEFLSFSPYFTDTVISSNTAEFLSSRHWMIPAEADMRKYLSNTEITFFLVNNTESDRKDDDGVLAMLSLPLLPLADQQSIKGSFPMIKANGEDCGVRLSVSITWHFVQGKSKSSAVNEISNSSFHDVPIEVTELPPRPTSVQQTSTVGGMPPLASSPSVSEVSEPPVYLPDEVESVSSRSSQDSQISQEKEVQMEEKKPNIPSAKKRFSVESVGLSKESPFAKIPPMSRRSSSSSQESASSTATYTKDGPNAELSPPPYFPKTETKQEETRHQQNLSDVQSMLGNLPPIPKPRSSGRSASLESTTEAGFTGRESSDDGSILQPREGRIVEFTSPLHRSIPPSETSSVSSPPGRREKGPVALPSEGGRSAIKTRTPSDEFESGSEEEAVVSIFVDKLYNFNYSPLMQRRFDDVPLYIDWCFLDFPAEECRVPVSKPLPRTPNAEVEFGYHKDYQLSRRRVALLEQYVETESRLEFSLLTDKGVDSEELAVATFELARIPTDETVTISLLNVDGVKYADLDVILFYSPDLFEHSREQKNHLTSK